MDGAVTIHATTEGIPLAAQGRSVRL
jgi:hypothetical protein